MKRSIFLVLLIILFHCTSKKQELIKASIPFDSTQIETTLSKEIILKSNSTVFIDFIHKFEGTDEFYIYLQWKKDYDDSLHEQADSIIYEDNEIKRTRFPLTIASQYFNLEGLREVYLFDSLGTFAGTGKFQRIEYFNDVTETAFIAVYKPTFPLHINPDYCIGNNRRGNRITNFSYSYIKSDSLKNKILANLNIPQSKLYTFDLLKIDHDKIYAAISTDKISYISEVKDNGINYLYKSSIDELIIRLVPLPVKMNGHPILLANFVKAETDIYWSALLIFNNDSYEYAKNNRVCLR